MSSYTHARVIGLKKGNLDAFILEVALGLGQVQGSVVRRSVPGSVLIVDTIRESCLLSINPNAYQFVRKVILSVDILTDQSVRYIESAANSHVPSLALG